MNRKRLICLALCAVLSMCFIGCKKPASAPPVEPPPPVEQDTNTYLVYNGHSDYKTVVPADATATELFAAEELNTFFAACTGHTPELVTDAEISVDFDGKYLSVGDTTLYRSSGMTLDKSALGTDGYKILTKGNTVVMNAAGENGKMYAVYEFLERNLGVVFYSYDEIKTPAYENCLLKAFDLTDVPSFMGRDPHYFRFFYNANPKLAQRMRTTSRRTVYGANNGEGTPWSSLWAHEQFKILPYATYGSHDGWYVMKDGEPVSLCWTNTDLQAQFTENLKTYILNEPDKKFFSITQEDGAEPCTCDACKASDAAYTHAGTMMRFNNAICRAIKAWQATACPDREIYLVGFAYQHTLGAPVKRDADGHVLLNADGKAEPIDPSVVGEDNFMIRFAPLYNCYVHEYMDEKCNEQLLRAGVSPAEYTVSARDTIIGWSSIVKQMTAWSYCTGFGCFPVNFNNFSTIQQNYRTLKEYGCIDVLDQGPSGTNGTAFESLRIYVQSRLLWNVDRNYNELVDDFMVNYYKGAAAEMKEYYDLVRLHYAYLESNADPQRGLHMIPSAWGTNTIVNANMFPRAITEQFKAILDRALEKAKAEPDADIRQKLIDRVEAETLMYRYLQLELYASYYYQASPTNYAHMVDEFERIARIADLTEYGEGKPIDEKIALWRERL